MKLLFSAMLFTGAVAFAQIPPGYRSQTHQDRANSGPGVYGQAVPSDYNSNVTPLYPGVTIARDVSFGPHPKDLVDIFTAAKGGGNRPVFIYVPGGAGNKIEQQDREANAFYDNIGRWATENGMVGVTMQRHPGQNWDDPAKDVSAMIQWLEANIAKYKGNSNRMFISAHSAGNGPLGTYIGRQEVWGPRGVGVKGAIFISGQWNVAPLQTAGQGRGAAGRGAAGAGGGAAAAGSACGANGLANDGAIVGKSSVNAGVDAAAAGRGRAAGGQVDAATQLERSTLPEFKKTKVKMMFITAELDPGIHGSVSAFSQTLHDELCKEGPDHCPTLLLAKGESHMSEVFAFDTPDKTLSGPILAWMKKVK